MTELRLHGMKSHDCHIFMQKLIPIAFREMVPEHVWSALTEVSLMFQVLCSTTLDIRKVQELEDNVVVIMCNLEKVFPPAFFDSMEHLILHLPYEARVGGPVQYRWMYPFERFLRELKKKVKNKAHVEASIVEAYIVEEIGWFTSHYFEPYVTCKRRQPSQNDDLTAQSRRSPLPTQPQHRLPAAANFLCCWIQLDAIDTQIQDQPYRSIETALPAPPVAPATNELPHSPLIDPTPLDPSSVPPGTSTVGDPLHLPPSQHPFHKHLQHLESITLAKARDFGPFHAAMEKLQTDPPIPEKLLVRGVEEARVAGIQPNWLGDGIWHDLQAYWNSDEFKAKSAKNKEAQLGRPPNRMEVFADCYKMKADGTWSVKRAEEVVETYQKLLEERVSQPASGEVGSSDGTSSILQEDQLWAEGGRKRGQVFGMGSDALMSDAALPWTTEARSSSSTTAPSQTDTKLDKIMLVLSALCTKMGYFPRCNQPLMPQSMEQRNRQLRMQQTSQKHKIRI
ncbi:hypothetical protein Sango_2793900 [Sesamum angolense]|uniref:DUF4218 domain-containing protein n=1 Tax=Sesamum angolense TaxID=2727404 RepID=A0AAE1T847_9LAMI|nr:hypothetical protein Sango_2793900 [Sesamum angolense]